MDSTKQGSSETSSDENDQPEKVNDDNTGTGRAYECTFCKRGFTNAQALGGHMNIHRKDKAKAKQVTDNSSVSNKLSNEEYMACKYVAPISSDQAQYYAALGAQANYQMYFPASNPNYPHAYHPSHLPANSEFSSLQEDGVGANLSLRIGLPPIADSEEKKRDGERNRKENEVDLELRLGQNP